MWKFVPMLHSGLSNRIPLSLIPRRFLAVTLLGQLSCGSTNDSQLASVSEFDFIVVAPTYYKSNTQQSAVLEAEENALFLKERL